MGKPYQKEILSNMFFSFGKYCLQFNGDNFLYGIVLRDFLLYVNKNAH